MRGRAMKPGESVCEVGDTFGKKIEPQPQYVHPLLAMFEHLWAGTLAIVEIFWLGKVAMLG